MKEAGHYSIAGFFFQLLASASDAIKLYFNEESDKEPTAVFSLEKLGQDGVVAPVCGISGKTILIQYKYSSVGAKLGASDMRCVLDAFRRSVQASGRNAVDFEYQLTTNRERDDEVTNWFKDAISAQLFKGHLHKNLSAKSMKEYPYTKLHPIFSRLKYTFRDLDSCKSEIEKIANSHGMHDYELETGINNVVVHLFQIANSPGNREVIRTLLLEKLLGRKDPYSLTGNESLEIQRQAILNFKDQETQRADTIERELYREIAEKAQQFPFVIVQGDGGCGKSVAMCEAARLNIESPNDPPGFAFVIKAAELNQTSIQVAVKNWRNQTEVPDQNVWTNTIERLERARRVVPVLAIYVDGVDERHGLQGLPPDSRTFLSKLIFDATNSFREKNHHRFSVVISCRNKSDLRGIAGGGFAFAVEPEPVLVSEFEFAELRELAKNPKIIGSVSGRITSHIHLRTNGRDFRGPSSDVAVEPEYLNHIRHPILWRCFVRMSVQDQHRYLDGESGSLRLLAEEYVRWFNAKIQERIGGLALNAIRTLPIVARRFLDNPSRIGFMNEDWIAPCSEAGCAEIHRETVFQEAVSAGVIEILDENQQIWKWKRPWLCTFLANRNIANG